MPIKITLKRGRLIVGKGIEREANHQLSMLEKKGFRITHISLVPNHRSDSGSDTAEIQISINLAKPKA